METYTPTVPMGRPPMPVAEKKVKVTISVDPELVHQAKEYGNISHFFNLAGKNLTQKIKRQESK